MSTNIIISKVKVRSRGVIERDQKVIIIKVKIRPQKVTKSKNHNDVVGCMLKGPFWTQMPV